MAEVQENSWFLLYSVSSYYKDRSNNSQALYMLGLKPEVFLHLFYIIFSVLTQSAWILAGYFVADLHPSWPSLGYRLLSLPISPHCYLLISKCCRTTGMLAGAEHSQGSHIRWYWRKAASQEANLKGILLLSLSCSFGIWRAVRIPASHVMEKREALCNRWPTDSSACPYVIMLVNYVHVIIVLWQAWKKEFIWIWSYTLYLHN